jgi:hypothetical protein
LSEYVGIGVAIELVKEVVSQQYPNSAIQVIDADLALDNALIPGIAGVGRLRPDYFVIVQYGPVIVLECKGSSSAQNRVSAIGKAMRQLASVSHNGTQPKGYAVHTIAGAGAIDATIFDPDDDPAGVWSTPADRSLTSISTTTTSVSSPYDNVAKFRAEGLYR